MEAAAASMGFCGSAVSFWGSYWLEEGLEKSLTGCALLSSLPRSPAATELPDSVLLV